MVMQVSYYQIKLGRAVSYQIKKHGLDSQEVGVRLASARFVNVPPRSDLTRKARLEICL